MSKRPRLTCSRCNQSLSYGAFHRHQKLPHCPGSAMVDNCSTDSDSTFCSDSEFHSTSTSSTAISETDDMTDVDFIDTLSCHSSVHGAESQSDSTVGTESDASSAPEVWSDDNSTFYDSTDDETSGPDISPRIVQANFILCLAVSMLQLFYSISDRAIAYILKLIWAVLQFFTSVSDLKAFITTFPCTIYSLQTKTKLVE